MAASILTTNQTLGVNAYLTSPNGLFCAVMQGDGNFVVYSGSKPFTSGSFPVWATNTTQLVPGNFFCIMQDDGNFVIYPGKGVNDQGTPAVWSWTFTPPGKGQYFLTLGDEGQLSVTSGTPSKPGTVLWSTPGISGILATNQTLTQGQYLTSANSKYFAYLQSNRYFAVYNGSGPSNQGSMVWAFTNLPPGTGVQDITPSCRTMGISLSIPAPRPALVILFGPRTPPGGVGVASTGLSWGTTAIFT
jgi:hypothetical protein